MQHPDGQQRIMHLASFQLDVTVLQCEAIITLNSAVQRGKQGSLTALVCPLPALLYRHIELVGKKTGKIRCGKWF